MSDTLQPQSSAEAFDADIDASHLISDHAAGASKKLIGEVRPAAHDQLRLSLGTFTSNDPPKGFVVDITPDPDPADSVVTRITHLGEASNYELVLHIANYSDRPIRAKVWQL